MRKIYIKSLNTITDKKIKNLNKFSKKIINSNIILSNKGFYTFSKNTLYKFKIQYEKLDENDSYLDFNESYIKDVVYQLPYEHKQINIEKHTYVINEQTSIILEYYKGVLNDFYISSKLKLNLNNYIFNEEMSYIKNMLI